MIYDIRDFFRLHLKEEKRNSRRKEAKRKSLSTLFFGHKSTITERRKRKRKEKNRDGPKKKSNGMTRNLRTHILITFFFPFLTPLLLL
jgi:hypothetical protein